MKPLFVRELSDPERHALQAGLRSSDGFTVRRCHILLASARGDTTTVIAQAVGCSPQAVRNVLRAFETRGLAVVALQSRRPHTAAKLFDAERSERLKALLHQSPRQSAFSRSLRSASKSLAAVCGRRDCRATTASPRASKARRTLRTACGLHPTAWAITGAVSPRAEAKRMWQRRTVNPSDERRPACKVWRSGPLNSRTKRGFIPQPMPHGVHTNNVC